MTAVLYCLYLLKSHRVLLQYDQAANASQNFRYREGHPYTCHSNYSCECPHTR